MKRLISVLLAIALTAALFVIAAIPASAKKSKSQQYLKLIHPADRASEDQYARWVIPWETFEQNKQYTFYATVMWGDDIQDNGGCAYVNVYSYSTLDAARASDFDYLFAFMDFGIVNGQTHPEPNKWTEISYTFDPSVNLRGSQGTQCEAVWLSVGFWKATGTISLLDIGVKDPATDKVLFSFDFQNGLPYDDEGVFFYSPDLAEEYMGEFWDLLDKDGGKDPEPEPTPSEDEPEPVSEDEPDPVSEDEPEPVSEDEPAPVSEDEPAPASEAEPAPASEDEPAPASEDEPAPASEAEPQQSAPEQSEAAPEKSAGFPTWAWIVLGCVAGAAVLAVVLILILRKKKA